MQYTDYKKLACALLAHRPCDWPERLDPKEFIEFAQSQGILCLLNNHPDLTNWPKPINQAVVIARSAANKILHRRREIVGDLFEELHQRQIRALLFKGAVNAYLIYSSPELRQHADIDMLINEIDYENVIACLVGTGFQVDPIRPTKFGPYQTTAKLEQPGEPNVLIDLHWKINNRLLLANTVKFDEVWSTALPIREYGDDVYGFNYQYALLACCIHDAGSLLVERDKLIGLYDAYLLINELGEPGVESVLRKATEKQIKNLCIDYMSRSMTLFGNDGQIKMVNDLMSGFSDNLSEPSAELLKTNRSWLQEQKLDWNGINGISDKLEYIVSKFSRKIKSQ